MLLALLPFFLVACHQSHGSSLAQEPAITTYPNHPAVHNPVGLAKSTMLEEALSPGRICVTLTTEALAQSKTSNTSIAQYKKNPYQGNTDSCETESLISSPTDAFPTTSDIAFTKEKHNIYPQLALLDKTIYPNQKLAVRAITLADKTTIEARSTRGKSYDPYQNTCTIFTRIPQGLLSVKTSQSTIDTHIHALPQKNALESVLDTLCAIATAIMTIEIKQAPLSFNPATCLNIDDHWLIAHNAINTFFTKSNLCENIEYSIFSNTGNGAQYDEDPQIYSTYFIISYIRHPSNSTTHITIDGHDVTEKTTHISNTNHSSDTIVELETPVAHRILSVRGSSPTLSAVQISSLARQFMEYELVHKFSN